MDNYAFETVPKIHCEPGGAARLGELCADRQWRHVMVITDEGVRSAGLADGAIDSLRAHGMETSVFSEVQADPPEALVEEAVKAARSAGADAVIGLGGGSSLDTAKLVALLCGTDQHLPDIYGIGFATGPRLPLVQIPTTAGTGSEATPISIVTTPTHEKKGVVSPLLYPDMALLDAELTLGLPAPVTAATGIDAMVHAIEAYTSKIKKNPISDALATRALGLLSANMDRVIAQSDDADARSAMLQGSCLAGMAFANAPVGAVHALAYPLGGHFHVPHGLSNALVLPPVLAFNRPAAEPLYAELASCVLPNERFDRAAEACDAFIDFMTTLVQRMPFPHTLREVGVTEQDLEMLTTDAMKIDRLLVNNPREVTYPDALSIYRTVL